MFFGQKKQSWSHLNHIPPKCRWCDNHTILHLMTTHIKLYPQSGAPILSANFFTLAVSRSVNTSGFSLSCCSIPAAITETCCRVSTCSKGCCESLWSSAHDSEKHQYSGHRTSSLLQFMKCNVQKMVWLCWENSRHQICYTKSEPYTCEFLLLGYFNTWRWAYNVISEQETITQWHGVTSQKNRVLSFAYGS